MKQCENCAWRCEEDEYHNCTDEAIGSWLENWLTRQDGTSLCRFCNTKLSTTTLPHFCTGSCKKNFEVVQHARLLIGERDFERRGFD